MKALVAILLSATLLTGCGKTLIKTEYKDKYIPVMVVPKATTNGRPELEINKLTEAEKADDGIYAKALTATAEQLKGYIRELETVIDKYNDLAAASALNLAKYGIAAPTLDGVEPRDNWVTKLGWFSAPAEEKNDNK